MGEAVLARRNGGETIYTISADLGISEESAYRYIRLAIAARIAPTVDEYRKQQNDRLDQTQRTIEENLHAATELAARAAAADPPSLALLERAINLRAQQVGLQLRLDERRAKLNGLDSPIKVDVEHKAADPWDAEMAEMIRQAKAAQPVKEEVQTDG